MFTKNYENHHLFSSAKFGLENIFRISIKTGQFLNIKVVIHNSRSLFYIKCELIMFYWFMVLRALNWLTPKLRHIFQPNLNRIFS